jgi:MoaA/NifB/PqqE/SkfB family radical SAM enzyme
VVGGTGLRQVVITNGITIRDDVLEAAAAEGVEFKFSIHRPDPRNDDVLRIRSFDRIMDNLARCRRRDVAFSLNTVVTSETVELMDAMAGFALGQGARKISFIPVVPRGRAVRSGDQISDTQLRQVGQRVARLRREYTDRLEIRCIDIRHHDYWIVENDGSLWIERVREGMDIQVCDLTELISFATRTATQPPKGPRR